MNLFELDGKRPSVHPEAWVAPTATLIGDVVDRRREAVLARAQAQAQDPLAFLRDPDLFGDLVDEPRFTEPYLEARRSLHEVGAAETVRRWVGDATG